MLVFSLKSPKLPAASSSTIFPNLPAEIRFRIYHLATFLGGPVPYYTTISAADTPQSTDPRYPYFLPRIALVNEATRLDVGLWYIASTEFSVLYPENVHYFCSFLDTFPADDEGYTAVRRLDFQMFGRHRPAEGKGNVFIDLMLKCSKVTEITLKFEVWNLLKSGKRAFPKTTEEMQEYVDEMLDLDSIVSICRLEDILESKSLVKLTVEFWPNLTKHTRAGVFTVPLDGWSLMEQLVSWLREGFRRKERDVDVRLVPSANEGLRWGRKGMLWDAVEVSA